MREPRRRISQASPAAVLAALLLASVASAVPGAAELEVRGPLALDGPFEAATEGGTLLLRDPGSPAFGDVTLTLAAERAVVTWMRVEEMCLDPPSTGVAQVGPVGSMVPRTVLEPVADLLDEPLPLPLLGGVGDVPRAAAEGVRQAGGVAEQALAQLEVTDASGSARAVLRAEAFCMSWHPGSVYERFELADLTVALRATDPYYTLLWRGADPLGDDHEHRWHEDEAPEPAWATLRGGEASADVRKRGEEVSLVARDTQGFWSASPRPWLPAGLLAHDAPSGAGDLRGDGDLLLHRAQAEVAGVREDGSSFQQLFKAGERREKGPAGEDRRVLEFLALDLRGADGAYASPAQVQLLARSAEVALQGSVAIPEAWGTIEAGNATYTLEGAAAELGGDLAFTLVPLDPDEGAHDGERRGAMAMELGGDVHRVETAGVEDQYPPGLAGTAAAVSAFAVLAGLLAYFWPALKFALAPLYTRIPPDALLAHGARETIYRLIKEEPGIHAHEVSARLGLGWGTAVYHLKLLERNGLVVAKHEGRYKRFFATGDQRLQVKEAVSLLRNATSRNIATTVASRPGLIQKQLCEALGLSPSLASWHLQRLEQAGVVRAERVGRAVRYAPGPAWEQLQAMAPLPALPAPPAPTASPMPPAPAAPPAA